MWAGKCEPAYPHLTNLGNILSAIFFRNVDIEYSDAKCLFIFDLEIDWTFHMEIDQEIDWTFHLEIDQEIDWTFHLEINKKLIEHFM